MGMVQDDARVVESEGKKMSGAWLEARQGLAIAVRISPPNNRYVHCGASSLRTVLLVRDLHQTLTRLQHLNWHAS